MAGTFHSLLPPREPSAASTPRGGGSLATLPSGEVSGTIEHLGEELFASL